jgi:hypothetical protein
MLLFVATVPQLILWGCYALVLFTAIIAGIVPGWGRRLG